MDLFAKAVVAVTAGLLAAVLMAVPLAYAAAPPPGLAEALLLTAAFGAAASATSLVPGMAAAMAARRGGRLGAAAQVLYVPAVLPPTAVGVLLLATFSYPRALCQLGAEALCPLAELSLGHVINHPLGVYIAMTVMALPVTFSIYDGALKEERAEAYLRSLGFSGPGLVYLLMKSLRPATASAFLFSWVRSFGELGVLLVFASYPPTASIYIYNAWLIYGVGPAVSASLITAAVVTAAAYLARRWLYR
ncbi:MAG: sulfate ABC transporter permease [Pyrobaculum sp.]